MAYSASRQPLTEEAPVHAGRAWVSPGSVFRGRSGTGTAFSLSSSVFIFEYRSSVTLHTFHVGDEQQARWWRSSET